MTDARTPVLEVRDLRVRYGHVQVLDGLSLSLRAGQTVGVVGESGSGKTTLAKTVLRTVDAAQGTVHVNGQDITRLGGAALRRWRRSGAVQYVFQDPLRSLDPGIRVSDSIAEGLRIARIPAAVAKERFDGAVRAVDLDADLLGRLPAGLSGGQRQRAAIARALVVQPRLLVLDEPVSALDAASRDRVVQSLIALRRARGDQLGMLIISHDIGSLAAMSDRLVVLHHGRIVEDGPTAQIVAKPQHPYTRRLIESVPVIDIRYPNRPAPLARS